MRGRLHFRVLRFQYATSYFGNEGELWPKIRVKTQHQLNRQHPGRNKSEKQ